MIYKSPSNTTLNGYILQNIRWLQWFDPFSGSSSGLYITVAGQLFIRVSYIEVQKNQTNGLVFDTMSRTEGWTWSTNDFFFYTS
jgi:hypothetical protein